MLDHHHSEPMSRRMIRYLAGTCAAVAMLWLGGRGIGVGWVVASVALGIGVSLFLDAEADAHLSRDDGFFDQVEG